MGLVRVKICGITEHEDASVAAALGASAIGFIFYPMSPRFVEPARAGEISRSLPPFILRVGVFVNERPERVIEVMKKARLDLVQLHGNERPSDWAAFPARIIRTVRVEKDSLFRIFEEAKKWRGTASDFLIEPMLEKGFGGGGVLLDGEVLRNFSDVRERFLKDFSCEPILAGGLTPENVRHVIEMTGACSLDVASGVEEKPGKKDLMKLRRFMREVAEASE